MKKSCVIEIFNEGKQIEEFPESLYPVAIDPDNQNDMLSLVFTISSLLFDAKMKLLKFGIDFSYLTLRVYAEDEMLFESIEQFTSYLTAHNIMAHSYGDKTDYITVNGIRYTGEVLEGMFPEDKITKGCVITTYRKKYYTTHQYLVVKDANKDSRPYRLVSLSGGYTILAGFESLNSADVIHHLEGMGLLITAIEYPRKTKFNNEL